MQYVHSTENFTGLTKTFLASGVNGALYGLGVMGLELFLFGAISRVMTEFENYRTQSEFERAYVFKMFFFVFIDGYLWWSTPPPHAHAPQPEPTTTARPCPSTEAHVPTSSHVPRAQTRARSASPRPRANRLPPAAGTGCSASCTSRSCATTPTRTARWRPRCVPRSCCAAASLGDVPPSHSGVPPPVAGRDRADALRSAALLGLDDRAGMHAMHASCVHRLPSNAMHCPTCRAFGPRHAVRRRPSPLSRRRRPS